MYSLVFLALIGLAAASPQGIMPYTFGMMPYTSHINPYIHTGVMPMHTGIMPYMSKFVIPTHDMYVNSMVPKPVEDTPEVKQAKVAFAMEYQKALMGVRQKRDLSVMPFHTMSYASPYHMMPYTSHIVKPVFDNTHLLSTPFVTHF